MVASVLTASGLAVLGPGTASAAASGNSIAVSPSTVGAGGTVHISGTISTADCPQSDDAVVTGPSSLFPPDGFGPSAARDAQGAFGLDYTVPTTTPSGSYQIGARCGGGNAGVSASLTVTVPVGAPQTGAGGTARDRSRPWMWIGVASLSLSGLVFAAGKRRASARVS
jgi:hypothetical protein